MFALGTFQLGFYGWYLLATWEMQEILDRIWLLWLKESSETLGMVA